jgi:phosphopantothenoylcysteine decarboxylase / phosphopantothenate---cysteine ligase
MIPDWDLSPPAPDALGDRAVPLLSAHLAGKRVALLVSGGIAAMKAPLLARALRKRGAAVTAFATPEALRYVATDALAWSSGGPVVGSLSPLAEHLSDDAHFDAYLVAPATYNSINKIAVGIADNAVTAALATALGRLAQGRCAVLIAPTMHGSMHNPILTENMRKLRDLGVRIVPPRPGYGKHNIPHEDTLVAEVIRALSTSPLRDWRVVVTGGPDATGTGYDASVQTRKGALANAIAQELWLRGAEPCLQQGAGQPAPGPPLELDPSAAFADPADLDLLAVGWAPLPDLPADRRIALPGPAEGLADDAGAMAIVDALAALPAVAGAGSVSPGR